MDTFLTCFNTVWTTLQSVKKVELIFESVDTWKGVGSGDVQVDVLDHTILLHEKGSWRRENELFTYTSSWRWIFDMHKQCIHLEHIRYGKDFPVALVSLFPQDDMTFTSCMTYTCGNDQYHARVLFDLQSVQVTWTVAGPKKNEQILLRYI